MFISKYVCPIDGFRLALPQNDGHHSWVQLMLSIKLLLNMYIKENYNRDYAKHFLLSQIFFLVFIIF